MSFEKSKFSNLVLKREISCVSTNKKNNSMLLLNNICYIIRCFFSVSRNVSVTRTTKVILNNSTRRSHRIVKLSIVAGSRSNRTFISDDRIRERRAKKPLVPPAGGLTAIKFNSYRRGAFNCPILSSKARLSRRIAGPTLSSRLR